MTDEQMSAAIDALPEGVTKAIEEMFALCHTITDRKLTIDDLMAGYRLATVNGSSGGEIEISMMLMALQEIQPNERWADVMGADAEIAWKEHKR